MKKRQDIADINRALKLFFDFVDARKFHEEQELSREVNKAFNVIVEYYTPRLISALKLTPSDWLYCSECISNYCWTQLWKKGQNITENRTPGGVFIWLKTTFYRYEVEILKSYASERKLMIYLDTLVADQSCFDSGASRFAGSAPPDPELKEYRRNLICEYYKTALTRLDERKQLIIKLSKLHQHYLDALNVEDAQRESENGKELSLIEIKEIMSFASIDATKSFKRRALRALVKELSRLFRRDMNQPHCNILRKEILEELYDRIVASERCRTLNERVTRLEYCNEAANL